MNISTAQANLASAVLTVPLYGSGTRYDLDPLATKSSHPLSGFMGFGCRGVRGAGRINHHRDDSGRLAKATGWELLVNGRYESV